jgi:BlaI family penicillinase repressor
MKRIPQISQAEWQVMRVLWRRAPLSAAEVVEALASSSSWKPKTIMTLLNRLVKKGALGFEKEGRANRYFPLVEESKAVKAESRSFLRRVYGGALRPLLATFLEEVELTDAEIDDLKRLLDAQREKR